MVEDDVSEGEEEADPSSSSSSSSRAHKAMSPDSSLQPDARLALYDNAVWRMDVSWRFIAFHFVVLL